MLPSGPPAPMGAGQSVSSPLLRSNSGLMGGQVGPGPEPSQNAFPSLVSQRAQFNNMNMLGNILSSSPQLSQSLGNGVYSGPESNQRGGVDTGVVSDPLSSVGNGMKLSAPPQSAFGALDMTIAGMSRQAQGRQFNSQSVPDHAQSPHLEQQNFQQSQQPMQQFPMPHNAQQQVPQKQQFQSFHGGLSGGVRPVKLDSQMSNDQLGPQQQQQIQSLRNLSQVKLEPPQVPTIRNLSAVKMEPQHANPPPYLQQQQLMLMSRQPAQAAAAHILHQQRMLQLQQQQQTMKVIPQQRGQMLQQLQQQNMSMGSPVKSTYEPGMGAKRLTEYMYQQRHRPGDNNIEFWRKFVAEFFAPHAKKKWCVSLYGSGRQPPGVFSQDVWHCDICNRRPGRGFDATVEVLPRLFKIKYDSGTLEELLYVDMPREYQNPSGQIVIHYAKAIQESVFAQLRVVRDGQLRIVFSRDLKICSWEFCARHHEELIPRKLLIPQVSQLGAAAQKYQAATQNAPSSLSVPELQNNCNMFVSSARQLAKALEVPLVNELGYTKGYIRCLQIAEVVNGMKDLIDYSRETGTGPMDSLAKLARRMPPSGFQNKAQGSEEQPQQQQANNQSASSEPNSVQAAAGQHASSNGGPNVNNSMNAASTSMPANSVAGLLHQNSMNSRQQASVSNAGIPYGGSNVQIHSLGSSSTMQQTRPNASLFHSLNCSSSNNAVQNPPNSLPAVNHMNLVNPQANVQMPQPAPSREADPCDSQGSVQKMLQDLMSNPLNGSGGSLGNEMKYPNGILPSINTGLNNASSTMGNGPTNNSINGGAGFGAMGMGLGQSAMMNGLRGNSVLMNGRVGMAQMAQGQSMNHQQDMSNQLFNGLGAGSGFNDLQFD